MMHLFSEEKAKGYKERGTLDRSVSGLRGQGFGLFSAGRASA